MEEEIVEQRKERRKQYEEENKEHITLKTKNGMKQTEIGFQSKKKNTKKKTKKH